MADQKPYDIRCRSCGKRPVTHRNVFRYMAGAGVGSGTGRGYRRYYLCPECVERGAVMQPYGLTCDRCDQGTPYFWSYDQMMRWVSMNGWYHYQNETICDRCREEEYNHDRN